MTQISVHDTDRVRLITFDRPDKLNAFDSALYAAAADALAEAAADDEHVHAVVLTGAGRAFSAGQDLGEMAALRKGSSHTSAFPRFVDEIQSFPKPLLAAVNGVAVGIGMTMLAHCDLVYVDEYARLRTPFTELGVPPEAASSLLFPARMGWQRAARLLFSSDWVSAHEAVTLGLALEVCPAGTVVERALAEARRIAAHPVTALRAAKTAMLDALLPAVRRARRVEDAGFAAIFGAGQ
jgi:enoyl-CoA hydratase/carnithine racemase